MKLTAGITEKNPVHTRLSVWVNGGLITAPGGICLRNEEVRPFLERLRPSKIYDSREDRPVLSRAEELGLPSGYFRQGATFFRWKKP